MTGQGVMTLFLGQAHALDQAAEGWLDEVKAQGAFERAAQRFGPFLRACAPIAESVEVMQKEAWERLFSGDPSLKPLATGEGMRQLHATLGRLFAHAEKMADWMEAKGQNGGDLRPFRVAAQLMHRLRADFEKRWPRFEMEELQQASTRMAQGEGADAEDLLRELQS